MERGDMSKIIDLELERIKRLFLKHVAPKLEEEMRQEQEFMDRIQKYGIPHFENGKLKEIYKKEE